MPTVSSKINVKKWPKSSNTAPNLSKSVLKNHKTHPEEEASLRTLPASKRPPGLTDQATTTHKPLRIDGKPIIRDLHQRLKQYSTQYTPEYFIKTLEYLLGKEEEQTMSPTSEKVQGWRALRLKEVRIQRQVQEEIKKIRGMMATSRQRFKREVKLRDKNQGEFGPSGPARPQQNIRSRELALTANGPTSNPRPEEEAKTSDDGQECSSVHNQSQHNSHTHMGEEQHHSKGEGQTHIGEEQHHRQGEGHTQMGEGRLEWKNKEEKFCMLIDFMMDTLGCNDNFHTIFPACYIFYMLLVSDEAALKGLGGMGEKRRFYGKSYLSSRRDDSPYAFSLWNENIQYYMIVAMFISSKYHEIYPVSVSDLIEAVNPALSYDKVIRHEGTALSLLGFQQFYSDNEIKYLQIFMVLADWTEAEQVICEFILESGLNNPHLYPFPPHYKAVVAIWIFEERFLQGCHKFNSIRALFPQLTLQQAGSIKKQYLLILLYNYRNAIHTQKKKYSVFTTEIEKILRIPSGPS